MLVKGLTALAINVAFIVGSATFYVFYEGFNYLDSFVLVITTITTTGYGYNTPSDDYSRLFTIFVIFFGILHVLPSLVNGMNFIVTKLREKVKATRLLHSFFFAMSLFVLVMVLGALFICYNEDTSFILGLYFAVETATTVGYGDVKVQKRSTKIFLIFYVLLAVILVALAFENFLSLRERLRIKRLKRQIWLNRADLVSIVNALSDENAEIPAEIALDCESNDSYIEMPHPAMSREMVSKYQFVVSVLLHLGKIDLDSDVTPWLNKFNQLDKHSSGHLSKEQLAQLPTEEEQQEQPVQQSRGHHHRAHSSGMSSSVLHLIDMLAEDSGRNAPPTPTAPAKVRTQTV